MLSIDMAGGPPNEAASVATKAAPVGVVSSQGYVRRSQRNSFQQFRRRWCRNRSYSVGDLDTTMPSRHKFAGQVVICSASSAIAVPTMSAIESTAPTS